MSETMEPVAFVGHPVVNTDDHDGQLRPAIGVQSRQVLRAVRTHPDQADGWGWTYNHAPMLAYWRDRFYLHYLSNPVDEHGPPGQTLLTSSPDGIHWERPIVLFPRYRVPDDIYRGVPEHPLSPGSDAVMHQRMGFYTAPNGRLLALGFYGISPTVQMAPNDGRGIGRVVREVQPDGAFGPIHFIRYNRHAGWHEGNTAYPFYAESHDLGFVHACDALLADKLATLQWWEEDRSDDGFYAVAGEKALSSYHLADGRVVGLWKWSKTAISEDEGRSWSPVVESPSLVMAGAKIWGQRTSDGRYALVYNPTPDNNHRWPLAVVTSADGLSFDDMLLVEGEVPPRRFQGVYKDFGLNYVRGICEGNGTPPDGAFWLTYSMNKEDIWVSRVPVPVRSRVDEPVNDTFDEMEAGGIVVDWNIYSPQWASVAVVHHPSRTDKSLELRDRDPYDYARATRVFPEARQVRITCRVLAGQADVGQLFIEVTDQRGGAPVWLRFDDDGVIRVQHGGHLADVLPYVPDRWYAICIDLDLTRHRYDLAIDGAIVVADGHCARPAYSVERFVLQTGPRRRQPTLETDVTAGDDLPAPDEPVAEAVFWINALKIETSESPRQPTVG